MRNDDGLTPAELLAQLHEALPSISWAMDLSDTEAPMATGVELTVPRPVAVALNPERVEWGAIVHEREPGVLLTASVVPGYVMFEGSGMTVTEALADLRAAAKFALRVAALAVPPEAGEGDSQRVFTERGSLRGIVTQAGTKRGRIWLQEEGENRRIVCVTGRKLAAKLGAVLYHRVELEGLITRSAEQNTIMAFDVQGYRVLGQLSIDDLERLVQADLADVELGDPDEYLQKAK